MNIPDSVGESSSKRQENGDASTGSERPLKKARFAWQVKGRHHLKNETNDSVGVANNLSNDSDHAGTSSENDDKSPKILGNPEQNLEILGDYLLKKDFNSIDSVILNPRIQRQEPSERLMQCPYNLSTSRNDNNRPIDTSYWMTYTPQVAVPMSMVISTNCNEDQCIARWQAKQMAKGFVDNIINSVLDRWSHPPLPPDTENNSRMNALNAAEFVNNLPGDNSIENQGILMAISAHGLQNASHSNSSNLNKIVETDSQDYTKENMYLSPPSSPIQSDNELQNEELNNNNPDSEEAPSSDLSWSYTDDNVKNNNDLFSFFPDSSNSYQYISDNGHLLATNMDYSDENFSDNHFDFMDAAVSFAIQNKGLTSFGTDYG